MAVKYPRVGKLMHNDLGHEEFQGAEVAGRKLAVPVTQQGGEELPGEPYAWSEGVVEV
jgi:hypothetical protein